MPDTELGRAEEGTQVQLDPTNGAASPEGGRGGGNSEGINSEIEGLKKQISDLERFKSERDSLVNENKKLRDEQMAKLVEIATASQNPRTEVPDYKSQLAELAKQIDEGDGQTVVDIMAELNDMTRAQIEEAFKSELSKKDEELRKLASTIQTLSPEYQKYQSTINTLAEQAGIDPVENRATLLAIAKAMPAPAAPVDSPPGSVGGNHITPNHGDDVTVDSKLFALMDSIPGIPKNLKPEEKLALAKKWKGAA